MSICKRLKTWCLGALVAILLPAFACAQSSPTIFIRTFATHDSVMLRWVPANIETWRAGIKSGYIIERFTTDEYLDLEGQNLDGKGTSLHTAPILPLAKQDTAWKTLIRADKMNAFVYQSIHETNLPTANDPKKKAQEQLMFGLVLKACDLSVATAKAHGLYFVDKTIEPGQVYIYRIRLAQTAEQKPVAAIATGDEKLSSLRAPANVHGNFRNRKAAITFDISTTREMCAGYIMERSEDSLHYERINAELLSFARSQYEQEKSELVYHDSLPRNYKTYWYRVRGYSYFGFTGPPSTAVKGQGRDEWTLYPEIDTLFSADNKQVQIKWHVLPGNAVDLDAFIILRAAAAQGPFAMLTKSHVEKTVFQFTDAAPLPSGYYEIAALNKYGDTAVSFPYFFGMPDNEPPPVPVILSGSIDTNGRVQLHWNTSDAPDLKGYRVFRSNTLKEEFIEVSDSILHENYFTDSITLQTLTRNVIYCVRSVDKRYNNSQNSKPVTLKRPDKIPPVAAVAKSIQQTDSIIYFSWINSSSDDIMCVELIERTANEIVSLGSWNGKDTIHAFTEQHPVPGKEYGYFLTVTDSAGNKTVTAFPPIRFQPRIYPALKNTTATPDFEKRLIVLSWDEPPQEVDRYIIYKAKKGEALRTWKTVDGKSNSVIDKELYPGNVYVYRIKAVMKSGAETKLMGIEVAY